MGLLKSRLTRIWERQTTPPLPAFPEQPQILNRMGVTIGKPTAISGTTLSPGRYQFRLLDPGIARNQVPSTDPDRLEFFNADGTKIVAELLLEPEN